MKLFLLDVVGGRFYANGRSEFTACRSMHVLAKNEKQARELAEQCDPDPCSYANVWTDAEKVRCVDLTKLKDAPAQIIEQDYDFPCSCEEC